MPKEIKGNASRKPPERSGNHSDVDDWLRRQMPHLQPIVQELDASIRATIPGLHYAVTWKRPYYGLPGTRLDHRAGRRRRFGERRLPRRCRLRHPTAARNHRPDPVRQGDNPGGGTTTRAAHVDRRGEPHAGLDLMVRVTRVRQRAGRTYAKCNRGHTARPPPCREGVSPYAATARPSVGVPSPQVRRQDQRSFRGL